MSTKLSLHHRPPRLPHTSQIRPLCTSFPHRRRIHDRPNRPQQHQHSPSPSTPLQIRPCPSSHRTFTTTLPRPGGKAAGYAPQFLKAYFRQQPRLRRRIENEQGQMMDNAMSQGATMTDYSMADRYPEDMGLLEATVVFPSYPNRPSFFKMPWTMTKMQLRRVWRRFQDFFGLLRYKFSEGRPYKKLGMRQVTSTAMAMHRNLYTAFAEGNTRYMHDSVCNGLRSALLSRLALRPTNAQYAWTLHRYINKPRVVSQRIAQLPIADRTGNQPFIRQAIVKIKSQQTLELLPDEFEDVDVQKGDREWEKRGQGFEPVVEGEKDVTEYFVIQKRIWNQKDEGWKVWGTVEETKWDELENTMSPRLERRHSRGRR